MQTEAKQMKQVASLLRLNKTEQHVFNTLHKTHYSVDRFNIDKTEKPGKRVAELVKELRLPRMTCHDALMSLKERGLTLEKRIGKEKYYSIIDSDKIVDTVRSLFAVEKTIPKTLAVGSNPEQPESSQIIKGEISIFTGLDNCHAVWRKIADLEKGDRLISIQPNSSLQATMDKLGIKSLYPSNDALNSKGIISEFLVHTTCYEVVYNLIKREAGHDFAMREFDKFVDRTAEISLIDTKYLTQPTELFFMHNSAYLVNWKDEVAIEIQNKVMRDFLFELYELAKGYGKKINQSAYAREFIAKIKAKENRGA